MKILLSLFFCLLSLEMAATPAVRDRLQAEIQNQYLPHLIDQLGDCTEGPCLSAHNDESWRLETADGTVCLPWTSCGFYSCMEEKYQCAPVGFTYFTELAKPTCEAYRANMRTERFSAAATEWIYEVMVCLQKGLVQECDLENGCEQETREKTCEHIVEFTLEFHPGCYLQSGVGVCELPLRDQIQIWRTVGPFLTGREWVEAFRVVTQCLKF